MRKSHLKHAIQRLAPLFPGWQGKDTVLFRRAGIVIQGLLLEGSRFNEAFVPVGFLQVLSEPFGHFNLTLGERFRDSKGCDLWITWDNVDAAARQVAELAMTRMLPPPARHFSEATALNALLGHPQPSWQWNLAVGALLATTGDVTSGRDYLRSALSAIERIAAPWAREPETALRRWLSLASAALVTSLRQAADTTANLLGIDSGA